MARFIYVNGRYLHNHEAGVHAEDRGFQFADAVYEVIEVRDGRLIDETRHLDRLWRSLRELEIVEPMQRTSLRHVISETVRRNRVYNGIVYMQVSRGAGRRDFLFPGPDVMPTLVCLARPVSRQALEEGAKKGIGVVTMRDIRWGRCDIKTVMLLPACLAKQAAANSGASEAWLLDDKDFVTEGASSNAWIINDKSEIITRALNHEILPGVTRAGTIDIISDLGLRLIERSFSLDEARMATEAFITSATNAVMPVVAIDGAPVGDGKPGKFTVKLRHCYVG